MFRVIIGFSKGFSVLGSRVLFRVRGTPRYKDSVAGFAVRGTFSGFNV